MASAESMQPFASSLESRRCDDRQEEDSHLRWRVAAAMTGKRKIRTFTAPATTAKRVTRSSSSSTSATAESTTSDDATHDTLVTTSSRKMVAFLRGVNVGGRVHSMKSIADALGSAGFDNVETFLASGNVIFDAPAEGSGDDKSAVLAIEHRVEHELEGLFGCHIPVFARSMEDVAQLGDRVTKATTAVNVVLVKEELTQEQQTIVRSLSTEADELELLYRAFVWYSATKMSESPLFKVAFDKKLGVPVTVRTVNTLRRIVKRFG